MSNPFFFKNKSISLKEISSLLNVDIPITDTKFEIKDIRDLISASKDCISFFHSKKYSDVAKATKASYCLTQENLKDYLPNSCKPIIVQNVLISTALLTEKFYPGSIEDEFDEEPKWNFYKYLFDRDGQLVKSWSSMTKPDSSKITKHIDNLI